MTHQISIAVSAPRPDLAQQRQSFDARALTGPSGIAEIILDDKVYTLRITRAGKLILTK